MSKNTIKNDDFLILLRWVYSKEFSDKIIEIIKNTKESFELNIKQDENGKDSLIPDEKINKIISNIHFNFKYQKLMEDCLLNDGNENVVIDINKIEDFMVDVYYVYDKIKNKSEAEDKFLSMIKLENMGDLGKSAQTEMEKLIKIFETCILESQFCTLNMIGIQKNMLTEMLNEFLNNEEYEKCAIIRDKLNSI